MKSPRQEDVLAARLGNSLGQSPVAKGAEERHYATQDPGEQHQPRRPQQIQQNAARGEHTGTDHVRHDQRRGGAGSKSSSTVAHRGEYSTAMIARRQLSPSSRADGAVQSPLSTSSGSLPLAAVLQTENEPGPRPPFGFTSRLH